DAHAQRPRRPRARAGEADGSCGDDARGRAGRDRAHGLGGARRRRRRPGAADRDGADRLRELGYAGTCDRICIGEVGYADVEDGHVAQADHLGTPMDHQPRRTVDDAPDNTSLKRHLSTALFPLIALGRLLSGHYAIGSAITVGTAWYTWR